MADVRSARWTEGLKRRLQGLLPGRDALLHNRWLRWLGPALLHPRLWHVHRRGIALGAALGVFFGLLVPIAQIPLSAAVAVALRANLPVAVASTLVTNPLTFGPVYYAAWRVGSAVLGAGDDAAPAPATAAQATQQATPPDAATGSWLVRTLERLRSVGKPLLLGLALFACGFGLLVYALVHLGWWLHVRVKRRRRLGARVRRGPRG